ncbi:SDR family NAD(P)-dependent oxidoreductase [Variovorax sp. LjRoot130]|uniref:SDR family NAD(P)-dependent oxidoreductase n=1 Tax=unclassified Variovorax TaxID=663243 RepID=UPI003ECFF50F
MSQANWDRSTIGRAGRFEGKLIVVAGAASGIGRAVGAAFAVEGGRVLFCGRGEALGPEVEAAIRAAGGEALCVRADMLREEELKAFVERGQLVLSVAS